MAKDNTLRIKVISGSVREGRFNDKPAAWVTEKLNERMGVEAELLDLRDYEMPFFNAAASPNHKEKPYEHPIVAKWTAKIAEADGFVMVTPEYNHGTSGVLKNAIDWVGPEWKNKAVGFVSYGSAGGARAVEQLRLVAGELHLADVRDAILIPASQFYPIVMGQAKAEDLFPTLEKSAETLITQLLWWADTLKAARTNPTPSTFPLRQETSEATAQS